MLSFFKPAPAVERLPKDKIAVRQIGEYHGLDWLNPPGHSVVDMICLIAIGFLIYGPVMLIGLQALDFVPKKAAGTAAGLTGLFGYLGGTVTANALMGLIVDKSGWDAGFILLLVSCVLAAVLFAFTWNVRGQEVVKKY